MASENTSSLDSADRCAGRFEFTAAFWILRLFLALRTFMAGLEKFENKGTYSIANYRQNMDHMSEGITSASFLPLWATRAFAHSIGYVLIALGVLLLVGVKPRVTLTLTGLVYVGLSFGLMAVQEQQGLAWLATYIGLISGALVLSRHDRFGLWKDRR